MLLRVVFSIALFASPAEAQAPVTFEASDGVVVHADRYDAAEGSARGVVLLFHQAGSNAAEYREIAPRLVALGFDALAVDQRMGGSMFGTTNRTMAGLTGPVMSFDAVLPDLAASLDYAQETWPGEPVLLWGSSYSADLVVALAADRRDEVAGVLSFSPVGLLRERDLLDLARGVQAPVFITYATADDERALAEALAGALPDGAATLDEPEAGTHGSRTLIEATNPTGAAERWRAVEEFLAKVVP